MNSKEFIEKLASGFNKKIRPENLDVYINPLIGIECNFQEALQHILSTHKTLPTASEIAAIAKKFSKKIYLQNNTVCKKCNNGLIHRRNELGYSISFLCPADCQKSREYKKIMRFDFDKFGFLETEEQYIQRRTGELMEKNKTKRKNFYGKKNEIFEKLNFKLEEIKEIEKAISN